MIRHQSPKTRDLYQLDPTPDTPITNKVAPGVAEPLVDVTNEELGLPNVSGPMN